MILLVGGRLLEAKGLRLLRVSMERETVDLKWTSGSASWESW